MRAPLERSAAGFTSVAAPRNGWPWLVPIVGLADELDWPDAGTSTWCICLAEAIGPIPTAASVGLVPRVKVAARRAPTAPSVSRPYRDLSSRRTSINGLTRHEPK